MPTPRSNVPTPAPRTPGQPRSAGLLSSRERRAHAKAVKAAERERKALEAADAEEKERENLRDFARRLAKTSIVEMPDVATYRDNATDLVAALAPHARVNAAGILQVFVLLGENFDTGWVDVPAGWTIGRFSDQAYPFLLSPHAARAFGLRED